MGKVIAGQSICGDVVGRCNGQGVEIDVSNGSQHEGSLQEFVEGSGGKEAPLRGTRAWWDGDEGAHGGGVRGGCEVSELGRGGCDSKQVVGEPGTNERMWKGRGIDGVPVVIR